MWSDKADKSLLVFIRGAHWSAKYESKRSHFVAMSDANLSLWQMGATQGFFIIQS